VIEDNSPRSALAAYPIHSLDRRHAASCAAIHATSFGTPWGLADFEAFFGAKEAIAHGAAVSAGKEIAGFVLSRAAADEAEILTIAVAPTHRRLGLARALLRIHCESLAASGTKTLFLEVELTNLAARALYASSGFMPVGERKNYYRAGGSDALVLRLDLSHLGPS
jgi:ribosomal-protein-alanine N-acetyltransferase